LYAELWRKLTSKLKFKPLSITGKVLLVDVIIIDKTIKENSPEHIDLVAYKDFLKR
jgi:hypothetical protein